MRAIPAPGMLRGMRRLAFALFVIVQLAAAQDVRFLAVGDTGTGTADQAAVGQAMARYCAAQRCDFVLLLGDNFYAAGVSSTKDPQWHSKFEVPYALLDLRFFASLGNHDYGGNVAAQIDYTQVSRKWRMPARYYYLRRGPAEILAIDTNRFDATQTDWLTERLERSDARWKFVFGHHPVYSYGAHGDTPGLKRSLLPVLKGRAQFYLCGHDHDRQVLQTEAGVAYWISGAGSMTRPVKKGPRTLFAKSALGFAHFTVTDDAVTARMVTREGTVDFEKTYSLPAP